MASVTFPIDLGGDGSTVTDDRDPTTGLRGGGYRDLFVPALTQTINVMNGAIAAATAAGAEQAALAADQVALAADEVALAADQVALAADEADRAEAAANVAEGAANYQGDYSAIVTYTRGQSVSYLGQVFYAKKTNLGITPVDGADWLGQAQQRGSGGSAVSAPVTLTNTSDGAINVLTTAAGQAVTLPDATTLTEGLGQYTIKNTGGFDLLVRDAAGKLLCFVRPGKLVSVSLVDKATAAGVWAFEGSCLTGVTAAQQITGVASGSQLTTVVLNGNRVLHLWGGTDLYGIVYDEAANTWGSATLIVSGIRNGEFRAALDANDVVFLAYIIAVQHTVGRTLSISGTSITVNTAVTQSTNPITALQSGSTRSDHFNMVKTGGSYVLVGIDGTNIRVIAFTVSGTTTTVGSTYGIAIGGGATSLPRVEVVASSAVLVFGATDSNQYRGTPYTVSGVVLTIGTAANFAPGNSPSDYKSLFDGARLLVVVNGSPNSTAALFSVSANVATVSSVSSGMANAFTKVGRGDLVDLGGGKYLLSGSDQTNAVNILTNTAGTLTAGTPLSLTPSGGVHYVHVVSASQVAITLGASDGQSVPQYLLNTSGASPAFTSLHQRSDRYVTGVSQTHIALPVQRLEGGTRHPATLIGADGVTVAGLSQFQQGAGSLTNTFPHHEVGIVKGNTLVFDERITTHVFHNLWGGAVRQLSCGSASNKSWVLFTTSGTPNVPLNFQIAQVELAA